MEITYKNGTPTIRLVKYVERGNFPVILYRIVKNLLWRGHGVYRFCATHPTDYSNVKFCFSNASLNSVNRYVIFLKKKLKEQTHGFKFQSLLFSL